MKHCDSAGGASDNMKSPAVTRGPSMKHCDSTLHVKGQSNYVDDIPAPAGMLHGAFLGSPVAHGFIKKLDTSAATKTPGVVSVFTYDDIPGDGMLGPIISDEPLLAIEETTFHGQPIVFIVAESVEAAREGVKACKLEIEELHPILCPREAFKKGDILQELRVFEKGRVDDAWKNCEHIISGSIDLGGQEHMYLETNRSRAIPREDNQILVYCSTQSPSAVQKEVASVLDLPMHKVEVDVKRLGGGFGGKEDQATHWACHAALACHLLKRPVQVVLNRADDMRMTGKRHPYKQDYRIGLDAEGKILSYDVFHYQNSGAFMDLSNAILERTCLHSTNAYAIPNVRISAVPCRTHLPSNTAFRGFGGPQGMFPIEVAIDEAAKKMGIPTWRLQEINLAGKNYVFHYGQELEDNRLKRCWDEAAMAFNFKETQSRVEHFNSENRFKKKGFAVMPVCFGISFTKTFLNQGSSLVHVYTDGSVSVTTGGIEMGQGVSSNMIEICSRSFGIPASLIKSNSTNTSRIANISPSAASATTDLNGNATLIACNKIIDGMRKVAAESFGCDPSAISIENAEVLKDGLITGLSWRELVSKTYLSRVPLMAHGFYTPPNIHFDGVKGQGRPFHYYTYGTCIIEATVDCLRGVYTIDSARLTHDLGRGIIPSVDLGQVEGGLAQGVGWVTIEELKFSDKGRLLSNTVSTYKCPDGDFLPDDIDVRFLENTDNHGGPLGSKAVGEPPFMYGIAAFFAVKNAIHSFSPIEKKEIKCPMTPEQTLKLLYPNFAYSEEIA